MSISHRARAAARVPGGPESCLGEGRWNISVVDLSGGSAYPPSVTVLEVIGLVSGLLAIFSFITGVSSARDLFRRRTNGRKVAPRRVALRPGTVFWVSAPVFVVTMTFTLAAGLGGSDTGGAQFVLLVVAAILLLAYSTGLNRRLGWTGFLMLCIVVLGASGLLMGVMTRGEELQGLLAGIVTGAGAGLLALALPAAEGAARTRPPADRKP